jgi:hypothetical protein
MEMWLFKKDDHIKVRVFDFGDSYMAMASTKNYSVLNCYGTTRENAKEMALFKLKTALAKGEEEVL